MKNKIPELFIKISLKLLFMKTYNLSEVSKDVRVVQLETNENSIISSMSKLVHVDSANIIYRSGKKIILFDNAGKYLNTIDALGNGPNEYTTIISLFVEANEQLIYVVDRKKIMIYNYNGEFIKK